MEFDLKKSVEILSRTPYVLEILLQGLSNEWTHNNEGSTTWSPFDIIGHLIHGEKTDWMTRMEIILSKGTTQKFDSFDRFAQFEESKGKTLAQLLEEFKNVRKKNLTLLESKKLSTADLQKKGLHPVFGEVTLEQLLATWAAHDLGHLGQIARVMAKQYKTAVGPWRQYLPILDK
jgi:uncharacterized damage-inducible protein DinB